MVTGSINRSLGSGLFVGLLCAAILASVIILPVFAQSPALSVALAQTKPPSSAQCNQTVGAPALQAPPWTGDLDGMLKRRPSPADLQRFEQTLALFRKYGSQYNLDYLLMMAEGFQESSLNQEAKSKVGAVGIMQLMPATGEQMKVGDIAQTEANIHAGVKYIRFMVDKYFASEPMTDTNKLLSAFASYNDGPGRVQALRVEAGQKGFDPNVWFDNVEVIAANRVGTETVTYVSNIYKYYIAYKLVALQQEQRSKALQQLQSKPQN